MVSKSCKFPHFYFTIFFSILFLCLQSHSLNAQTDQLALLSFKQGITNDPLQALTSWNGSTHFCSWAGVKCSLKRPRVVTLSLQFQKLEGSLSPAISNLTFLKILDLRGNNFRGQIPAEIGRLIRLQRIFLMENRFEGEIPANISLCNELRVINFNYNNLTGKIPYEISTLPNLVALHLSANRLTGGIPPVLGNLSLLLNLSIAQNFLGGVIPEDLGNLKNLELLQLSNANLSGMIPGSIFNLSRMSIFSVAFNNLTGSLPLDIGDCFPGLTQLHFGANRFSGVIPSSLSSISSLRIIDVPDNNFRGKVPIDLGRLQNLERLNLGRNLFGSHDAEGLMFIESLINCSKLEVLSIDGNMFFGELPDKIGNLSVTMKRLLLGRNRLFGRIPLGIANLVNLTTLNVSWSRFSGPILPDIGKLFNLRQLYMNGNSFSGKIPSGIGNLKELFELRLDGNMLEGHIPSSLGNSHQLKLLNLSNNNLSGVIPLQVFGLSSLTVTLNLARNSLSGGLPVEVRNFRNLKEFDLSDNEFSGSIPESLGSCSSLEHVFLQGNSLHGTIPSSLSALKILQDFDLSRNNMTGGIPMFLQDFVFLRYLNLSFNRFEGEVPKHGIFANRSAVSLDGNIGLCGDISPLELPSCPAVGDSMKRDRSRTLRVVIGALIGVLGLVLLLYYAISVMHKRSRKRGLLISLSQDWSLTFSYKELEKATNGFSSENLLGEGSFASVYGGYLYKDKKSIAIKVLNVQRKGISKVYMAECDALRNIRHRNLVKILGFCSSLDSQGQEFKAIVLELMPNGCLEKWLHPNEKSHIKNLNMFQRLSIAIDIASALEYLHCHCQVPVAHCDLKPGNVLLDADMCAHLSDFGLAKFVREHLDADAQAQTNSKWLRGSIGYVAPEYGTGGRTSISGDVYSFGILLLEMFTGKRPIDEMFTDGLTLHKLAKSSLQGNVMDIIDPRLILPTQLEPTETTDISSISQEREQMEQCFTLIIRIGVACSQELSLRMNMKDANTKLQLIRDNFFIK